MFGGGGHARVVTDCLQAQGRHVTALVDTKFEGDLWGIPRVKEVSGEAMVNTQVIIAIGDNAARKRIAEELTTSNYASAVHPSALLSSHAQHGVGCMILHRAVIQAESVIGRHVIINTGAQIDHDCVVEDFVHVAPRATLCGNVRVGEGALIGAGAVVIPGKRIGAWAVVGAGAVVIQDIPDYAVAVGNPAKVIHYNKRP